jgi:uncharacterized protein
MVEVVCHTIVVLETWREDVRREYVAPSYKCGTLMYMTLDTVQVRVLGALIEKEIATPEGYPLSLNALVNASNQRSSRDPVMELTEEEVRQALHVLEDMGLTAVARDSRVAKYEHRIRTVLNLRRDETAVLCLLFLRGPQTPGELRSRADRLYSFDDLEAVQSTLERLASRGMGASGEDPASATGPLVMVLPRQPGSREARWSHLLGGPVEASPRESPPTKAASRGDLGDLERSQETSAAARLAAVENEVAELRETVAKLEARLSGIEILVGPKVAE